MVNVIIVTHGTLAQAYLDSAKLIVGDDVDGIQALSFQLGDSTEELRERIRSAVEIAKKDGEVLILTDLMSGSPFNATAYLHLVDKLDFEHLTGINFPVFLEIVSTRFNACAKDLVEAAIAEGIVGSGRGSILDANAYLDKDVN